MGAFKLKPKFGKKSKGDKFSALPPEWKENIEAAQDEEVMNIIAKVSLDEVLNKMSKDADEDLKEKVAQAREAGAQYREGTKMNSLKIAYARQLLESRGRDVGHIGPSGPVGE